MPTISVAPTGVNDTANLQAALNSIRSAGGGTLKLEGAYNTDALNATAITGITIDCAQGTTVVSNAMTTPAPIVDFLSSHVVRVNGGCWTATHGAKAVFLIGGGDQYVFDEVRANGSSSSSTLSIIGAASVQVRGGQWMNYSTTNPCLTISNKPDWGITSKFASFPAQSVVPSNIHFLATEIHGMGSYLWTTYMRNAYAVFFLGGNHDTSGGANAHMLFQGACNQITSVGQTFYSELGTAAGMVFMCQPGDSCTNLRVLNIAYSGIGTREGGGGSFPGLWVI